jgi:hypothetical protein
MVSVVERFCGEDATAVRNAEKYLELAAPQRDGSGAVDILILIELVCGGDFIMALELIVDVTRLMKLLIRAKVAFWGCGMNGKTINCYDQESRYYMATICA